MRYQPRNNDNDNCFLLVAAAVVEGVVTILDSVIAGIQNCRLKYFSETLCLPKCT